MMIPKERFTGRLQSNAGPLAMGHVRLSWGNEGLFPLGCWAFQQAALITTNLHSQLSRLETIA